MWRGLLCMKCPVSTFLSWREGVNDFKKKTRAESSSDRIILAFEVLSVQVRSSTYRLKHPAPKGHDMDSSESYRVGVGKLPKPLSKNPRNTQMPNSTYPAPILQPNAIVQRHKPAKPAEFLAAF